MRYVAFDSETWLIEPGNLTPKPVVASFAVDGALAWLEAPDVAAATLRGLLVDPGVTIVTHNGPFDFGVFSKWYPDLMALVFQAYADGKIVDTWVRQKLIDVANGCHELPRSDGSSGYALADLEWHWLGRSRHEDKHAPGAWRFRYRELDGVPLEQWPADATRYALEDAEGTLRVEARQRARYPEVPAEGDTNRAAWALHLFSAAGIRTEAGRVAALKARLQARIADDNAYLRSPEVGFLKLKPLTAEERRNGVQPAAYVPGKKGPKPAKWSRDMAAIKAAVEKAYATAGLEVPRTETGLVATDEDTLMRVKDRRLNALGGVSGTNKLLTAFIPLLEEGARAAINASFNPLVKTGRTSCRKPNLQQIPKEPGVRECFVPSAPDKIFVSVDYDCAELRSHAQVLLWLFKQSAMAEFFQKTPRGDPHSMFSARVLGVEYGEALRRKNEPAFAHGRDFGKVGNFGLPGGLGVDSTIEYARANYGIEMSREQAQKLKSDWLATWPEMERYFAYVSKLVGEGGATIRSFGNGLVAGDKGYCDTCNFFFQNLTAEGAKDACFHVAWECYVNKGTPLFGVRPVVFVHDEIIAEGPRETLHEWAHRLADVMCERMRRVLPDIPVTASPAAMNEWTKKAEPTYDYNGRLVPWTPAPAAAVAA